MSDDTEDSRERMSLQEDDMLQPPTPAKPETWMPHIHQEGARFHVVSYSTVGPHCFEKMCEINRPASESAKPEAPGDRAREIAGHLMYRCGLRGLTKANATLQDWGEEAIREARKDESK